MQHAASFQAGDRIKTLPYRHVTKQAFCCRIELLSSAVNLDQVFAFADNCKDVFV